MRCLGHYLGEDVSVMEWAIVKGYGWNYQSPLTNSLALRLARGWRAAPETVVLRAAPKVTMVAKRDVACMVMDVKV